MIVGLCQTLDEAMARTDADDFAVAVLDFGLGSDTASPVARRLAHRGVPFVLYTGKSSREPSLAEWACPIVEKPASPRALVSAVGPFCRRSPCRLRDALSGAPNPALDRRAGRFVKP